MIRHLDNLLRHLFMTQVSITIGQVGFQPPDEEWRKSVLELTQDTLNVYLFDLRENRKLRSNERVRSIANGLASEEVAPTRLDCHYLISAWSPAQQTKDIEPTVDEHTILYGVAAALMKNAPLNPSEVYGPDSTLEEAWGPFWNTQLPTEVLLSEGFPKLAEFWGAMGTGSRWKPVIYLVVTLPVLTQSTIQAGDLVTELVVMSETLGTADSGTNQTQVTGHVLSAGSAVVGAVVRLETPENRSMATAKCDRDGSFKFTGVQPGVYQLRWHAPGYALPAPQLVEVRPFEVAYRELILS